MRQQIDGGDGKSNQLILSRSPARSDMVKRVSRTHAILERGKQVLIGNYARLPVVMDRGEGCWLWDTDGNKYLDLFAGFGGAILGHCHPALIEAATKQAQRLWHVGNTFYTEPQIELAERLN